MVRVTRKLYHRATAVAAAAEAAAGPPQTRRLAEGLRRRRSFSQRHRGASRPSERPGPGLVDVCTDDRDVLPGRVPACTGKRS